MPAAEIEFLVYSVERLRRLGAEVWLVEAPMHPLRSRMVSKVRANIRGGMKAVQQQTGVTTIYLPEGLTFQPDQWADPKHLNQAGAARYSAWLATELDLEAARTRRLEAASGPPHSM